MDIRHEKLPTQYPLKEALWIYAKRLGFIFLISFLNILGFVIFYLKIRFDPLIGSLLISFMLVLIAFWVVERPEKSPQPRLFYKVAFYFFIVFSLLLILTLLVSYFAPFDMRFGPIVVNEGGSVFMSRVLNTMLMLFLISGILFLIFYPIRSPQPLPQPLLQISDSAIKTGATVLTATLLTLAFSALIILYGFSRQHMFLSFGTIAESPTPVPSSMIVGQSIVIFEDFRTMLLRETDEDSVFLWQIDPDKGSILHVDSHVSGSVLQLMKPPANSCVDSSPVLFEWNFARDLAKDETFGDGRFGGEYFVLQVGEVDQDPFKPIWTIENRITLDVDTDTHPLQPGKDYVWRVAVVKPFAVPIYVNWELVDASPLQAFTYRCTTPTPTAWPQPTSSNTP